MDIENKTIIITGAARGLGAAMAKRLATHKCKLGLIDLEQESMNDIKKACEAVGAEVMTYAADVTREEDVAATFRKIVADLGPLHGAINNAGITRDALLIRMNEDQWDTVLNTNLKGAFYGMKAAIRPMMKNRFGRIINITSIVGLTGNPGQANYAASKAGLIGLTQSIAKEVASRGITVNCIAPGWIDTEMTDELPENSKNELLNRIPVGKIGTPEDIAHATLFLASDEANYITGQTITVDGGRVIN